MRPKHILLSRVDRIGDVILSTSCIEPLRKAFPDAKISFLVQSQMADLLSNHPCIDELLFVPAGSLPDHDRVNELVDLFRSKEIDAIVHLHPDKFVEEAAWEVAIPKRIGFEMHKAKWLTDSLPYLKKKGDKHESLFAFDLLKLLGVGVPDEIKPSLQFDINAKESLQDKFSKIGSAGYVVLHTDAYGNKPRIPIEYFIEVADYVLNNSAINIVLTGNNSDDASILSFFDAMNEHCHRITNLSGILNLGELAYLLSDAKAFLSRDTGPAHLAAAVGCSTVTVFMQPSPTMSSKRWRPLGKRVSVIEKDLKQRWFESDHRYASRHLKKIPISEVVNSVCRDLGLDFRSLST